MGIVLSNEHSPDPGGDDEGVVLIVIAHCAAMVTSQASEASIVLSEASIVMVLTITIKKASIALRNALSVVKGFGLKGLKAIARRQKLYGG